LSRYVPQLVGLPEAAADRSLADAMVGVVDGRSNLVGPLCDLLRSTDVVPLVLDPHEAVPDGLRVMVDLTALRPDPEEDSTTAVTALFARLRGAALASVPEIVVVTGLGGAFGLAGSAGDDDLVTSTSAAALGIVRTMAREFPGLRWRVVDLPASGDPDVRASQIAAELACGETPSEVGYQGRARQTVTIAAGQPDGDSDEHRNDLHLGAHSVVLVTGGARGIGARCATELAERYGCAFEVVGRTPLPVGDEAPDLAEARDERAIRKVLLERGQLTRPAEVEAEVRRITAAREVRANLAELQRRAASVGYHTADVRDTTALAELVEEVRMRHGRLDGVIHAAGIRDDKRIGDKTADSFAQVFDTKVRGADLLADAVDYGGFAVFFGSVSGVFGNAGQVDYAAANCVLDVLAQARSGASRERRVLSIDWGPWSGGGMVTPELARQYERRGVGLVEPDAGAAALVDELRRGAPDPQVVLMAASPEAFDTDGDSDG
jgi:NAD(P)-dependent dehydrogenase (short-subunit alcohol dehydrogenase family)